MSGAVKTFRDLIVWQKSMSLVTEVYKASANFPADERFGLTSQLRRCVVSIPSNIAEGFGRDTTNDYLRFLGIAKGSLYEAQTQLEIGQNLHFIDGSRFTELLENAREIERMLTSMMRKLKEGQSGRGSKGQSEGNE
ncbi:MAG: four helix bundle protein [Pirellula sp.]